MHDLEAVIGDSQKEKLKIEVGEQEYTKQDMKKFFRRCIRKIEKQMPGENESLDHVEQNLNLMTTLEGTGGDKLGIIGIQGYECIW